MWQESILPYSLRRYGGTDKKNSASSQLIKSPRDDQYTTPSRQKLQSEAKSKPTDANKANSRYISCVIQLRDHIGYISILLTNVIARLRTYTSSWNEEGCSTFEGLVSERAKVERVVSEAVRKLQEALYKNSDTIGQFSNVIGEISSGSGKAKQYKDKLKEISEMKKDKKEDALVGDKSNTELEVLAEENFILKSEVQKLKQLIDKESKSHSDACRLYEDRIKEIEAEKGILTDKLQETIEQLYYLRI
eukprot:TRINITY_DN5465_c0_g4_i2.p1 TRINITY_DN5465_c0_g4~~TRINITY_DN5465_c0_g4_i2.p1  ORF type:complete len:248 (+),score=50.06 TRINITY_DN5465_c0_g4_i2:71-814(+)